MAAEGSHPPVSLDLYDELSGDAFLRQDRMRLGCELELQDGRKFRFARAGAALNVGELCVAASVAANHRLISVASAAAIGATNVTVTLGATAATANQYAQGYMHVTSGPGAGQVYKIRSHPAANASASLVLTLMDPLTIALTAASVVTLRRNPYADVVISVTDQQDLPVGVPVRNVTSGYYFWLQTRGIGLALADEAIVRGEAVTIGTGTAGAIMPIKEHNDPQVGTADDSTADGDMTPVFLMLDG